jgi:hypothetical protein
MNILNRTILEVKIGDRFYNLECTPDSPLPEINQALVMMNNYIVSRMEEAKKNSEVKEESKVEELQQV